jgi:hypothetical protein
VLLGDTGADGSLSGEVGVNPIVATADAACPQVEHGSFLLVCRLLRHAISPFVIRFH